MHDRTRSSSRPRLSTVRHADLLVVLEQWSVVEISDHAALVAQSGLYAGPIRRQLGGARETRAAGN